MFYGAGAIVLVAIGTLSLFLARQGGDAHDPTGRATLGTAPSPAETPAGVATLYYVAADGMSLVAHQQELPLEAATDTLARARMVIERQLAPPPPPLASPFPTGTELRAVYLAPGGDAFVDLNLEVTRAHGGGSLDELFTVYALVNALTSNIPDISAVQILVEGREVDTLAGHIDLRQPLQRNLEWVAGASDEPVSETDEDAT